MRRILFLSLGVLLCLGVATSGSTVPYTGSLSLTISGLAGVSIGGGGSAAGVTGPVTFSLSAGDMATTSFFVDVTDPAVSPLFGGIAFTVENGAGSFSGGAGIMPLMGAAKLCLFAVCSTPPPANVAFPLTVVGGPGGTTTMSIVMNFTVIGAPWTTGTASLGTLTAMGGTTGGGAAGGGQVTLVTPMVIMTNVSASAVLPSFATLTLNFVPEPGSLLLLGAGIAGLAALGRGRLG